LYTSHISVKVNHIYPSIVFEYLTTMTKMLKKKKNPAAVALGRLGGLKGGPARIAKLSAKGRSALARKAVTARWKKQRQAPSQ
jgi:hypothetical protein